MPGIRLEFAQFGDFDSFDVHRSTSSMTDINNLPTPITTNLKSMFYVDDNIIYGTTYYYRVVAWRGDNKAVGDEVSIAAKNLFLIDLKVENGDLVENGSLSIHWTETNISKSDTDGILFDSYQSFLLSDKTFNFNQDFKISFDFKRISDSALYPSLFNNADDGIWNNSVQRFNVAVGGSGAVSILADRVFIARSGSGTDNIAVNKIIENNVLYHVRFERNGNIFTLAVDDVVQIFTDTRTYDLRGLILGLGKDNAGDGQFHGYINNLKAKDLIT
ncbi:MAG: F5/8 type C domain protein [Podoviridae sp. ctbh1]|nr:MAG: F5/8 type C domain protein [Podoviridae sp. ctbh1]